MGATVPVSLFVTARAVGRVSVPAEYEVKDPKGFRKPLGSSSLSERKLRGLLPDDIPCDLSITCSTYD
jgi:hypothetical protein